MLRRIFAAAFSFAALTTTIGATSAVADEYGPDPYPCTIELSNGAIPEDSIVVVTVTCDEESMEAFDAAAGDAVVSPAAVSPAVMSSAMVSPAVASPAVVSDEAVETVTLMLSDGDGETVYSESMDAPVDRPAAVEVADLEPGDYTAMLADADGTECADRATLTVTPVSAGADPDKGGSDPGKSSDDGDLAVTGATGLPYLAVAGGLLLAGITALVVVRRARRKA